MRNILCLLTCLIGLASKALPIPQYNQLTTNKVAAGSGITISIAPGNPGTATISSSGGAGAVTSVNGQIGVVALTTTDITEGLNRYWTDSLSNALYLLIRNSATNNPGFLVNLKANTAGTADLATTAISATNLIGVAAHATHATNADNATLATRAISSTNLTSGNVTNAVIDLRGSQTLQMKGPNGGDGYIWGWGLNTSNDRLVTSNTVFSNQIEWNDGLQGRQGGINWNLSTSTGNGTFAGTVTANLFSGSGASLTALPAAQLTGTIDGARLNTLATNGYLRAVDAGAQVAGSNYLSASSNLPAAQLTGSIADARLSANVALLNAQQNFSGSNSFAALATTVSNGVVSAYGTNGGMIFNANPTNNSFEVKSNLVFGAQKQYLRPSQNSGFEPTRISIRNADGTLSILEAQSIDIRSTATGARSILIVDTGGGAGGLWVDSASGVYWTSSATDGSGAKVLGLIRNADGVLEVNNGTTGTFADLKVNTLNFTNLLFRATNAAPAGFSVGTTVPAVWFSVTNNAGTKFLIPGFAP